MDIPTAASHDAFNWRQPTDSNFIFFQDPLSIAIEKPENSVDTEVCCTHLFLLVRFIAQNNIQTSLFFKVHREYREREKQSQKAQKHQVA